MYIYIYIIFILFRYAARNICIFSMCISSVYIERETEKEIERDTDTERDIYGERDKDV